MVSRLCMLLRGKLCLFVFDDAWEIDTLWKIVVTFAKLHGSKFVITTRNPRIFEVPDRIVSIHYARCLSNDQSLELFKKIAFHQTNTSMAHRNDLFVDVAKEIVKKCDGLPLLIIFLARLLRTKQTIQEWMNVRIKVSSKNIEDHVYGKVEDILGLGYSNLNHSLKSCFMYLSLFPKDVVIPCGMLMRCWIAEGFFKSMWLGVDESIEDVARRCLDELIQRGFVQIISVNYAEIVQTIRVHHLFHDFANRRAATNFFSDTCPSNSSSKSTMRSPRLGINNSDLEELLELLEDKASTRSKSRLRSFIALPPDCLSGFYLKILFTNYPLLRVLILDGCRGGIPDVIGSLIHLRCLQLSFCSHIHLPDSLQNLRNLLSFDIRLIHDEEIWNTSGKMPNLKQMKHLRYLRLPWEFKDYQESSLNLHDVRNLKVLWGIPSGKWMVTELKYLSPTIEKLGISEIKYSEELKEVYQCPSIVEDYLYSLRLELNMNNAEFELQKLQHCTKLQKLGLEGKIAATGMPFVFPPYLLKLELEQSYINDQDSFADALQRLPYLKFLKLAYDAYVGVDLTFPANSLLDLETLQLYVLQELKRIHVMEGAMPHLKSLDVNVCHKLKEIPQSLRHLVRTIYDTSEVIDVDELYEFVDKGKDKDEDEDEDEYGEVIENEDSN